MDENLIKRVCEFVNKVRSLVPEEITINSGLKLLNDAKSGALNALSQEAISIAQDLKESGVINVALESVSDIPNFISSMLDIADSATSGADFEEIVDDE